MTPRLTLATFAFRFLLISWFLQLWVVLGQPPVELTESGHKNTTREDIVCRPFGECEPCPKDSLNEPFCQPFGNRRLMHCLNITAALPELPAIHPGVHSTPVYSNTKPAHMNDDPRQGETPAWESCGRIVDQERADFWEFVACNVVFAGVSLFVLFARSRRLQALQARQLAARIGLIRSTNRGRQ